MSEEILRALMELFALTVKQDGGMLQSELDYVTEFLSQQIPHENVDAYLDLFLENAGPVQQKGIKTPEKPTVRDSLRVLGICNKINKTLTREQKIIVLIRVFEMIDSDRQYTPERMNIVTTIAEVFTITRVEFDSIYSFVSTEKKDSISDPSLLVYDSFQPDEREKISSDFVLFLKVPSVNLVFFRCFCQGELLLNGLPAAYRRVYIFAPGSSLRTTSLPVVYYGDIVARYAAEAGIPRLTFVADHLTYVFRDGVRAITDISFSAGEGNLLGIMGISGTGKTTLLSILSGLLTPGSGDVRINSRSIYTDSATHDGVIGYIPQDDMLIEDLTVFENLYYAAALCFAGRSKKELCSMVDRMLTSMGLYEKRDFRIGTPLEKVISGGQRKRLNIALELIREPSVLFLDEPTSGLSSRDSENVLDLLHELTRKGKLVIMVVHQPSSDIFKGFDKVLILDQEGRMAYFGNPTEAIVHFKKHDAQINSNIGECPSCGNVNPETLFNILDARVVDEFGRYTKQRKVSPEEWAEVFRKNNPEQSIAEEPQPAHSDLQRPGWFKQLALFISRDIKNKIANRQYLLLILLEGPVLGFILSYVIRYIANPSSDVYIFRENENIPIYIFMSIIVALFLGLTVSAEEIFRDRKILRREQFLNLSHSSYLMAKIVILLFISAIQTFLFLLIANPMLGIKGMFAVYWIALLTTAFCANMIGINISSAFNSAITIYIIIPLLMIPMMVLSGAMFPFDKLNRDIGSIDKVPLIAEIMPTRWTYEALMVQQFTGNEYDRRVYSLKQQMSISDFNTIYRIPRLKEIISQTMENPGNDIAGKNLVLIAHEINKMKNNGYSLPFRGADSLKQGLFNSQLGVRLLTWLDIQEKEYMRRGNHADMVLDNYINNNREVLDKLYNTYHNDKMEEIMRKYYEKNKIIEYRGRLVQNIDLIYLEPSKENISGFRTHFMAPVKNFFGLRISTFTFNITLVLFSSLILYLLLYFDILKHIITFIESTRLQKREKI